MRSQAIAQTSGEINFDFPHDEPALVGGPVLEGGSKRVAGSSDIPGRLSLGKWRPVPVQFIKMDVEGAETDVLQGARKLLDASHPNMMIELHHMPAHWGIIRPLFLVGQLGYHIEWLGGEVDSTAHILAQLDAQFEIVADSARQAGKSMGTGNTKQREKTVPALAGTHKVVMSTALRHASPGRRALSTWYRQRSAGATDFARLGLT